MSRASKDDCEKKLATYMGLFHGYNYHLAEYKTYRAAFDEKLAELLNEHIPAKNTKVGDRQSKWEAIRDLLGGVDGAAARAASGRITAIDARKAAIKSRILEIMQLLDGQAEPMEVHNLFSEARILTSEETALDTEREGLVELVNLYNSVINEVKPLEDDVNTLTGEIETLQETIDRIEGEAAQDRNHYDVEWQRALSRKNRMDTIMAQWDEFECSSHGLSLPEYENSSSTEGDEVPEDSEDEDEDEMEIPDELEEPGEPEESEEFDLDEEDYLDDDDEENDEEDDDR